MRRVRIGRVVGGLLVGGLILVGAELGLRLAGVQPAYSPVARAGWRMAGNLAGVQEVGPRGGSAFTLSTNDVGLRTTLPRPRRDGVLRVALLGDSTVFGWGADDGATVADGLEQGLRDAVGLHGPVEVLNAGQPGYSTVQAQLLLEEAVVDWRPDLVIHFVPKHDQNLVLVSDRQALRGANGLIEALELGALKHSRMYAWLSLRRRGLSDQPFVLPEDAVDGERLVPRVGADERTEAVLAMHETVSGWGGTLALGVVMHWLPTEVRGASSEESLWAEAFSRKAGIPYIDARSCCGPSQAHFVQTDDSGHLNDEGNLWVGRAMAPKVAKMLARER